MHNRDSWSAVQRTLLVPLLVPLLALLLGSCVVPDRIRAAGGVAVMKAGGQVSLGDSENSSALGDVRNDLDDSLDLASDEISPYLRLDGDWSGHRVSLSGFAYSDSGNGELANDFGDIPALTGVTSELDYVNFKVAYSYGLVDIGYLRVAPGLALTTMWTDTEVRDGTAFEQVETLVTVPMPFVQVEADLGPLTAVVDVGAMDIDLSDADGTYWDLEALLMVKPGKNIDVFAGYRYLEMDSDGSADQREFDADIAIRGWILGLGVTF